MRDLLPLEIENLTYGLRDPLFENVSLTVRPGEFMTVLVDGAAGKSALFDCLLGNLKPTSGRVRFWGQENRGYSREMIQNRVGWIVKRKESYAPWVTVREDMVGASRLYRNWNPRVLQKLAAQMQVDLDRRMSALSVNEAMKVKVIKALAFEPELIVLDEMDASLVLETRRVVTEAVLERFVRGDAAVLYVCQTEEEALRFSNRVPGASLHAMSRIET